VVPTDCVDHVRDVLPGQLLNLLLGFRQGLKGISLVALGGILQNVIDRQAVEIWDDDVFDIIAFDDASLIHGQITQMEYRNRMISWEVRFHFGTQESINLFEYRDYIKGKVYLPLSWN